MEHECKIMLSTDNVKEFVRSAEQCDFDVNVFYNRFVIDAKSILGVLSLDLSRVLTVQYAGLNPMFEKTLRKFCVA
ncbi:HPr family phosphocarrier protein [Bariatricus massiliensis]|uniref:HPr family phosphocarrier protein n=1 Tax=Bariatricus massiliensis TaxID=1745713 RepID=A0ABS8DJD4_9FIRM|nr:HPr family phosphocarrier protein [Bariatricus massiliensis]MCB7305136.1 HPr family phosphocarrier protein [Bariatricus massiliensis]MCB7375756.1 HPr family phosphocarrier protein [Bariatricus massiliensis]MCB7388279.1 HPr family phosphocarrier protein [Bariatricus massiliensis]MCB7412518.1 HPr family phosphocarrier protein [Bariatricus massiliensis]MCQ5254088.1 HPr family phosphocarrier protein [Bariatricus massiliensis]